MIHSVKAELRKMFSVRSTYYMIVIGILLLALLGIYIEGYQNGPADVLGKAGNVFLASSLMRHSTVISLFGAIIALLLLTHEYRYNTINYSLTNVNSRSKFLSAKIIAVFLFVLCYTLIAGVLGLAFMVFGLHLQDLTIPSQAFNPLVYFGKMLFFTEGYALAALLFGALLRNQIAAFVVLFVEPTTFEGLLSLLLKHNQMYLPFTALEQVVTSSAGQPSWADSPAKGSLIFLVYLVVGWIVAWVLFLKRDAN